MQLARRILVLALCAGLPSCASSAGPKPGRASLPDPLSRVEALARILVLEDRRSLGPGSIQSLLQHEDPAIRRRAALAAGRIGDPLALQGLLQCLHDPEVEVRRAAAFALGLIGSPDSVAALRAALSDPDPGLRGRASEALSRITPSSFGPAIAEAFRRALPHSADGTLRIRGDDPGRADDPWIELRLHLVALARLKDAGALKAALLRGDGSSMVDWWVSVWAAMRVADPALAPILLAGAVAEDPYIRSLAARGLGALRDVAHLTTVRRLAEDRDPGVVREALRALAAIGAPDGAAIAARYSDSPDLGLRREALLALATLPRDSRWRRRVIDNVGHSDPWIRAAAWPALIRIDAEEVGIVLSTIGPDSDWRVRQSVASALGDTLGERAAPLLLAMLRDGDLRVVAGVLSALTAARGLDAVPTLLDHIGHTDAGVRSAAVLGLSSLEKVSGRRFNEAFSRAFDVSLAGEDVATRLAVVDSAAQNSGEEGKALLRRIAGSDPIRAVRQRALSALGDGFASAEEAALRAADARRLVSIYEPAAELRYSPHVLITTTHGKIEMTLDVVEAPLTSMAFVRLAQAGFFNGIAFHQVEPGFGVQGGDPRGDGLGGPWGTRRCEYNTRPFGRGAVGLAISGKDTGGSQFFITLAPQPQLDGFYTQFGQVLSGLDVVEKIRPGDLIERIDVFDGRESL